MKPIINEWIVKAEGDFYTLAREAQVKKNVNYDGICFHVQQCVEKYLKARLCEASIELGKIHDLVALLDQVVKVEPSWESFRADMAFLTEFGVHFRYPGESADREDALNAQKRRLSFRKAARRALGLE